MPTNGLSLAPIGVCVWIMQDNSLQQLGRMAVQDFQARANGHYEYKIRRDLPKD